MRRNDRESASAESESSTPSDWRPHIMRYSLYRIDSLNYFWINERERVSLSWVTKIIHAAWTMQYNPYESIPYRLGIEIPIVLEVVWYQNQFYGQIFRVCPSPSMKIFHKDGRSEKKSALFSLLSMGRVFYRRPI